VRLEVLLTVLWTSSGPPSSDCVGLCCLENHYDVRRCLARLRGVTAEAMAQQNGCSMELAVDEDGLEGAVDGELVDGSSAVNGHTSSAATCSVDGAAAAAAAAGPSSAPAISRVDCDVIRLIAQHLQNLGLKYNDPLVQFSSM